jgi:peptide deformylase
MAVKRINTIPEDESTLHTSCVVIQDIDETTLSLANDMLETLRSSERPGVGIAAPQIGILQRMIVVESTGWKNDKDELVGVIPLQTLINPKITKYSEEKEERFEGCLSVPQNNGYVERPKKIKVSALNLSGETVNIKASGFLSRVLQHEIDHLDGILFTDRIKDKTKILRVDEPAREHETEY